MPDYFLKLYDKDYAAVLEDRVVYFDDDAEAAKWCRANSTHGERWEYNRECHVVVGAAQASKLPWPRYTMISICVP